MLGKEDSDEVDMSPSWCCCRRLFKRSEIGMVVVEVLGWKGGRNKDVSVVVDANASHGKFN